MANGKTGYQIHVYCPCCNKYHTHGYLVSDKSKPSHRCAHCNNKESLFKHHGYFVAPLREIDFETMNQGMRWTETKPEGN